ncbi:hypothetical protein [Sinomonas albida]|uniref:lipopolysaccharide biosynthesis protein n=1 Tax=Sinomonas albida TaxID=369942 RepID=UPI00301A3D67
MPTSLTKRFLGFAGLPMLSSLAPFLLLPWIARLGGSSDWAAINIGQSVGMFAAMIVSYGYTMTGPARVTSIGSEAERAKLYLLSVTTRVAIFVVAVPAVAVTVLWISPAGSSSIGIWMGIAAASSGLSMTWYGVATGSPRDIALFDAVPRAISVVSAAGALFLTRDVVFYPLAIIGATLIGIFLFTRKILSSGDIPYPGLRDLVGEVKVGASAAIAVSMAGIYSTTPVPLAGLQRIEHGLASLASADRLYRIMLTAISVLSNTFQSWVTGDEGNSVNHRPIWALAAHSLLGICGFSFLAIGGPTLTAMVFGEDVAATHASGIWYGIAFLAVSINTSLGLHILVPMRQSSMVMWSTLVGGLVGIPAIVLLTKMYDGDGTSAGFAFGEVAVCIAQAILIFKTRAGACHRAPSGRHFRVPPKDVLVEAE